MNRLVEQAGVFGRSPLDDSCVFRLGDCFGSRPTKRAWQRLRSVPPQATTDASASIAAHRVFLRFDRTSRKSVREPFGVSGRLSATPSFALSQRAAFGRSSNEERWRELSFGFVRAAG